MIASSAFFVLNEILGWPVILYDGSWIQWGQLSASSGNGGKLKDDSPWQTDISSRSDVVTYNFNDGSAAVISSVTFTGTGIDDLTASGTFTGKTHRLFRTQIDGVGTPDTFKWTKDSGASAITWDAENEEATGADQALTEGISIKFGATTGHTLNDRWDFTVPSNKRAVELLAYDGSVCSSRKNLDDTETLNPTDCTYLQPNSYVTNANQIEDADETYMGAGGTSDSGGGPIAPGY